MILDGALVAVPEGGHPSLVADLVGHPMGAEELEADGDLLLAWQVLGPVRTFDLRSLTSGSILYDVASQFEATYLYNRPYTIVGGIHAVMTVDKDGTAKFHSAQSGALGSDLPPDQLLGVQKPVGICSAADGSRVVVTSEDGDIVGFARSSLSAPLHEVGRISAGADVGYLFKVACDERGQTVAISDSLTDHVFIVENDGRLLRLAQRMDVPGSGSLRNHSRPSFTRDGLLLAIGSRVYSRTSSAQPFSLVASEPNVDRIVFDQSGDRLLELGGQAIVRPVQRDATGRTMIGDAVSRLGAAVDAAFVGSNSAALITPAHDLMLEQISGPIVLGLLAFGKGDTWLFADTAGRFDLKDIEGQNTADWVMPDDPLRPLSPTIFMRDYFEPRLLPRLVACHEAEARGDNDSCAKAFKPIPPLAELNRIQPPVKIVSVQRSTEADEVLVEVEVAGREDTTQKNGKMQTAAYDLRLFRDGQLVGQWPEPRSGAAAARDDLSLWRQSALVPGTDGAGKVTHTFAVHLAHRDRGQPVTLTAYAFNEDRVKSETAPASYTAPSDMSQRIPRAYVVTIGINGYQNPKRNLEFAVNDAEDMAAALQHIAGHEVVPVSLVSEAPGAAKPVNEATKDKIRAVLMLLAGEPVDQTILGGIANADRLAKATPDDLVILTFSGHGYTEQDGAFYLLPSDSGTEDRITKASVPKFISSEELSEWLRKLDAGEMAMVIDACHSAASVEAGGFKPGPMGDRGLGQLAYDKGMRILAASQADDVALEVRNLHHGLLTYALVDEGLQPGSDGRLRADLKHDGAVTLGEWLKYGEERTPSLYEDARAGRVRLISRDSTVNAAFIDATATHAQTPALFDFNKATADVVVSKQ